MATLAGSLFVGAACFLLGVLMVDLLWDARSVLEEPFTEEISNAIREYYFNNLVYMARKTPYILAPLPLAFVTVGATLTVILVHAMGAGDRPATAATVVSMALTFPLIGVLVTSTLPTIAKIQHGHLTLPLEARRRLQRRIFYQHVLYTITTVMAIIAQLAW